MVIISYILLFLSNLLISACYYIKEVLIEVNLYELVYYYTNDKSGYGNGTVVFMAILNCLWVFVLLSVFVILTLLLVKKYKPLIFGKFLIIFAVLFFLFSVILTIKISKTDSYIYHKSKTSDLYEKYYVDTNKVSVTFPKKKNNLILIYLESMESSLVSKANGGAFEKSRIPELENIALQNTNFSNSDKLGGAYNTTLSSFTMASLVASSSGTPVDINLFRGYDNDTKILPNVRTLGDLLYDNGYNLKIIQGTDIKFAATDIYYNEHKNYDIVDYNKMVEKGYIEKGYVKWWGVEDKKLFDVSKSEILELSKEDKPFAVTLYTMDTHFPNGYLDESCDSSKFDDQLSNVYACSSKITSDFIEWIKEQDFYKDTTIVILGDHLTMQNAYFNGVKAYDRTIYNAFINSKVKSENTVNRTFNNFDMYPTILASIGVSVEGDKLGFGTNLFGTHKTLSEEIGKDKFEKELLKSSKYYEKYILK